MKMRGSDQKILLLMVMVVLAAARGEETYGFVTWNNNYYTTWGHPALVFNETSELHLTLDHNSGSGFESYSIYGSGSFNLRIKAPQTKSTEVITSFYVINTNMFTWGEGGKEQRFRLWFDPTKEYHSYRFLWNPHQLVFYVDDTPIRVYRKNPSMQTMFISGSVKNGSIIDPKQMPYTAKFQASKIEGCATRFDSIEKCFGPKFWWNRKENWQLSCI